MKKLLKILSIIVLVILIILIVVPIFFKKPIKNLVEKQINETLNAKVGFGDLSLSFIRNFPNVYVGLQDFTIVGTGDFEKDTLLSFKKFSVTVDIISAIKMENIKVKSVLLDRPRISAKVLKNGKANWDIMKETGEVAEVDTTPSEPFNFKANLKKFEISHAYIKYQDDTAKMAAQIDDLNFLLSGDFSESTTDMKINTTIESLDFLMDNVRYLKHAKIGFAAQLGADLEHSIYTLKDNEIKVNDLSMSIEGAVKMPTDTIEMDLKYKTNKADFKTLLSLIPAIYMQDFPSIQTSGVLKLDGYVKGVYIGDKLPNVGLKLVVENANFKYPDLPQSVDKINVDADVFFDGVQTDNTTVDVNKFHFDIAGNPFDMNLHIKTPISDMGVSGNFTGKIDFASLTKAMHLDSMTLKGILESNVDIMGKMSSIDQGKYEDFKADGNIKLTNFEFSSPDFPQGVKILTANLDFSPKYVTLSQFDSRVGLSDFQLNGKLEKFIPYVFSNDTLVGSLSLTSNLIDLNEFMSGEETTTETPADTSAMTVFEVPSGIDFTMNSKIGQLNMDKLKITDILGVVIIKDQKVVLKNLGMSLLKGSMVASGEYNTQDVKNPYFDFDLQLKDIDVPSAYTAFNTVQKLAPVAQNCSGSVSAAVKISSYLDQGMMPVYKSMAGNGRLTSKSLEIANSNTFVKIADALHNDKFRKLDINDLDLSFEIKNGRVYVSPFETKLGNNFKMTIGGDQGIDQTLNYIMKFTMPRSEFGGAANQVLDNLTSNAVAKGLNIQPGENVNIDVAVGGTVMKPEVKPVLSAGKGTAADMKAQLKATATEKVEEVKEKVSEKAKEKADQIIKDAEVEAQKIRDAGKEAADKVRKESNDAADKALKEGTNPLKKELAKRTADKLRKEGEEKAKKIENEVNAKADAVINKAKEEAAKL